MAMQSQPVASASTSAISRVFAIFELAEAIFLDVPVKDIIVNLQRTCKQFKEVIKESTPIQRALLLKPYGELHFAGPQYGCSIKLTPHWVTTKFSSLCDLVTRYDNESPNSWPAMFCTQPPINTLRVSTLKNVEEEHEVGSSDGLGVRFRDVLVARKSSASKLWFVQGIGTMTCPRDGSTAKEMLSLIKLSLECDKEMSDEALTKRGCVT